MKLYYAGQLIGGEDIGSDTVHAFLPSGQQQEQVSRYLRAKWAVPRARGNRLHTFPFQLDLAPEVSTGDMLAKLTLFFTGLPSEGPLDWIESDRHLTCNNVVLRDMRPSYRNGVASGVQLDFSGGAATEVTEILEDNIMTRRAIVNLASGVDTGDVVYATALDAPPTTLLVTVIKPAAVDGPISVDVIKESISSAGFSWKASADLPAGYQLSYAAII